MTMGAAIAMPHVESADLSRSVIRGAVEGQIPRGDNVVSALPQQGRDSEGDIVIKIEASYRGYAAFNAIRASMYCLLQR